MDARVPFKQLTRLDSRRFVDLDCIALFVFSLIFFTSPGSDGDNIVSHFAVNYHNEAERLGVDLNDLYSALLADGDNNPPEWNIHGRQVDVYKYSCPLIHVTVVLI